jgi:hypothetical protein
LPISFSPQFSILEKFGKISVIATVHKLQIVEKAPNEDDTNVDYIVTSIKLLKHGSNSQKKFGQSILG